MSLTLTRRHNVDRFGYLIPTKYGNVPMVGAVATYRPGEGRFGGAVAVEEGTTNYATNGDFATGDFTGWGFWDNVPSGGAREVVSPGYSDDYCVRLYSPTDSHWGFGIRSGYNMPVSQGDVVTFQFKYKGIKPNYVYILRQGTTNISFTPQDVPLENGWRLATYTWVSNFNGNIEFMISILNRAGETFIDQVQYEKKSFPTSFVNGTRAAGKLEYPQSIWNHATGTFAAWVKTPTDVTTDRVLTLQWGSDAFVVETRFGIRMNTSGRFVVSYGSPDTLTTADSYNDGQWHHVALTWVDGTADIHFYVDGERVASASKPISVSNPGGRYRGVIPIGHRGFHYNDQWWNGLIDELLFLPYAASEEEIRAWYEADGPIPPHPDALLQWDWQAVRPATMVAL